MPSTPRTRPRSPRRFRKRVAFALSLPLLVLLLAQGTASLLSHRAMAKTHEHWRRLGLAHDALLGSVPALQLNESALRLESLAAPLGIDFVPVDSGREAKAVDRKADINRIRAWTNELRAQPSSRCPQPSQDLGETILSFRDGLEPVVQLLLEDELPTWPQDPASAGRGLLPNLLGTLRLHVLLTGDAAFSAASGDQERCLRLLEAAWRLEASLSRRPELICALIELGCSSRSMVLLRRLPELPQLWLERLADRDARARIIGALHHEGIGFEAWTEAPGALARDLLAEGDGEAVSTGDEILAWLLRPWMRFGTAEASREWADFVGLRARARPCSRSTWSESPPTLSRWNVFGSIWFPQGLGRTVWRAEHEGDLQAELITRIVLARELAADGALDPSDRELLSKPGRCVTGTWLVDDLGSGSFRIRWTGEEHPYFSLEHSSGVLSFEHLEP